MGDPEILIENIAIADFLVGDGNAVVERIRSKIKISHCKIYHFEYDMPADRTKVVHSAKFYDTDVGMICASRAIAVSIVCEKRGFVLAMNVSPTTTLLEPIQSLCPLSYSSEYVIMEKGKHMSYRSEEFHGCSTSGVINSPKSKIFRIYGDEKRHDVDIKDISGVSFAMTVHIELWNPQGAKSTKPKIFEFERLSMFGLRTICDPDDNKKKEDQFNKFDVKPYIIKFNGPKLYEKDDPDVLPASMFVKMQDCLPIKLDSRKGKQSVIAFK